MPTPDSYEMHWCDTCQCYVKGHQLVHLLTEHAPRLHPDTVHGTYAWRHGELVEPV